MRYFIVDEDGAVFKTDDDTLAEDYAKGDFNSVIDTELGEQIAEDGTRFKIEDAPSLDEELDADGDEEQDDSDPGISDRERI